MKAAKGNKQTVQGVVAHYLTNKHDDYDRLVLTTEGRSLELKFPPHTARFIQELGTNGAVVEVVYDEKHHDHKRHLSSVRNVNSDKTIDIKDIKPPHPPETGHLVTFDIAYPKFTRGGKHDEITGIVTDNNFIHFHPEEYEEDESAWMSAPALRVKAKKRTDDAGFVNSHGHIVYHTHSVEILQHVSS